MRARDLTTYPIREAATASDVAHARALFEEYAEWLAIDLCFQGFEEELATLPGKYAPPRGRLFLAGDATDPVGCIALRPLDEPGVGEVKRLYVRPVARGTGLGRALAETVIEHARAIGYRELRLDTADWMHEAIRLYATLGFKERPPYYHNPMPGVVFMSLALS
ncbi:MAG: GNAT family N-acetyltransferase [Burkholderiales bacterium]